MPRIPNHLEEVFGTSGSSPTDRISTKSESATGSGSPRSGSSNGASYSSASQHDIGVLPSASGKEALKTARPGTTVFNKLKKVFERPRQRGVPSKGSSQGADPEQSIQAPPLDERVDSFGLASIEENIRAWEASLDTSSSDQPSLGPEAVVEAHHSRRDSAQSVTRADPFAAGFSGPVPLSSLSPGFQDFVLRTIGNEVLREFRYRGPGISRELVGSSKMSVAKQVSVSFDDVREKNLKQLRKLNQVLFPVRYEEKFYTDVLSSGEYAKLAYYSDICVGAIASKLEKRPEGGLRLYIMTLGVLAPYRRLGIASKLLEHCLDLCKGNAEVHEAYLHVQTSRDEAIAFYKKFGFEIVETLENYYKRIEPPHAHVLMKTLQQPPTGS